MTHVLLTMIVAPVDWVGYLVQGGMLQCIWPLTTYYEQAIAIITTPIAMIVLFQVAHEQLTQEIRAIEPSFSLPAHAPTRDLSAHNDTYHTLCTQPALRHAHRPSSHSADRIRKQGVWLHGLVLDLVFGCRRRQL